MAPSCSNADLAGLARLRHLPGFREQVGVGERSQLMPKWRHGLICIQAIARSDNASVSFRKPEGLVACEALV